MSIDESVRTAVVFVHGLLERRPMDVLDLLAKTALTPDGDRWEYTPQPMEITDSYEARRYAAPSGVDLYEYDWSFLMVNGRYAGFIPALARVLIRRPRHVPDELFGIWRVVVLTVLIPLAVIVALFVVGGYFLHTGVAGWIIGVATSVVVLTVAVAVFRLLPRALTRSFLTTGFVNVARYFDIAPESHAARRAIRGGLVDLLYTLQQGHYARVVVVGHGIGGYIAYDALTTLWAEMHELRAASGPAPSRSTEADDSTEDFQRQQFCRWQDLRRLGNPWRITDFVTVGTPMALADVFVARPPILSGCGRVDGRRALFGSLIRRGVVCSCPPLDHDSGESTTLGGLSPFAVTRWTNIWFPVRRGAIRGDWFAGALAPLFGTGVRDIAVSGSLPERLTPGLAHTRYFKYPEKDADGDLAFELRKALALEDHSGLDVSVGAPDPDPATVGRLVYRSWQRSM
ncbi:hypothetical protein Y900_021795 [Mycolicibacterium aromaticivorans JS19b1 = JCM 16368]|uniref:Uncharacterized protein n=1 Tax=Mycolicibacterium aromaticivorans JS19b1 = JCM 16368 TaxID=1440774 RepID=A0A064CP94_9MYCO|nr:hypothetical protein [Mycolicibacterium aromaticivorans]KDF01492.1 hypothetical protein Y900_021795 [Mycolicibacterium aromaticivorans JS19b1 = JCM 16368]